MRVVADVHVEQRTTTNVIADSTSGRTDRTVMAGAHLDSVDEGPGINDNGSGTAVILETAVQMAELGIEPRNAVRFAFWGAEESGLIGSQHYVDSLTKKQLNRIARLPELRHGRARPNFVRFVYDGDGSAFGIKGPSGSQARRDGPSSTSSPRRDWRLEPTEFDGRSDYDAFINAGIPAGGLFTGAEGIKTAEQAAIYGGTAGVAYDPCYHQACDTYANNCRHRPGPDVRRDRARHVALRDDQVRHQRHRPGVQPGVRVVGHGVPRPPRAALTPAVSCA